MISFVGYQENFANAVKDLIELEYDAVEAYNISIQRLSNQAYKNKLAEFKSDHLYHIKKLSELLEGYDEEVPEGPDNTKQWLAKGKVILGSLMSDKAILRAMNSNEVDTNSAYEHMCLHDNIWEDSVELMHSFLKDERKHKLWLEKTIEEI